MCSPASMAGLSLICWAIWPRTLRAVLPVPAS